MNKYKDEVEEKWGNTLAYKQSKERTKNWTKNDYKRVEERNKDLTRRLSEVMDLGVANKTVQELVEEHHSGIETFYDCPPEMYRELGKLYINDERLTAFYDNYKAGLAKFLCEAIEVYCENKLAEV